MEMPFGSTPEKSIIAPKSVLIGTDYLAAVCSYFLKTRLTAV